MTTPNELRDQLMRTGFGLRDAAASPVEQFGQWLAQAQAAGVYHPRAMTLATIGLDGRPAARMVMLASFDDRGFDFITDDRSPKVADLERVPFAALVFYWAELERQIRIAGAASRLTASEADTHFAKLSRESQLAAWIGQQTAVVKSRAELEDGLLHQLTTHAGQPVPRPPYYTGYRIVPTSIEFWQARDDHINDRVRYRRADDGAWIIELLNP